MKFDLKIRHTDRLIIKALLNNERITANDGFKFYTTRVSNSILKLRKLGLQINSKRNHTSEKRYYVNYTLVKEAKNIQKAKELYILEEKKGTLCN